MSASDVTDAAVGGKLDQDHKRELDQKYKWALGEAVQTRGQLSKRPDKPLTARVSRRVKDHHAIGAKRVAKDCRKPLVQLDNDTLTSDSSAEEDVKEASAAPEPDAGITYSFDAERGPAKGSQILSMALTKAVEKYEVRATEKLVKEEYEVVGKEKEEFHDGYAADEDDFELV